MTTRLLSTTRRTTSKQPATTSQLLAAAVLAALAAPVPAQLQFDAAVKHYVPAIGDLGAVAFGDVDGDGDLDMVCANSAQYGQQNRLYLNDGTGVFTDVTVAQMPAMLDGTLCVALGDVDGDGDLDILFGNGFSPGLGNPQPARQQDRLLLNDGTGTFRDATATHLPVIDFFTLCLALGDLDGDGDLDLVAGINGQNRLFLNNGAGVFTDATAANMPVALDPTRSVALADLDGDGDLDLVTGSRYSTGGPQNRICLNQGNGSFTDATIGRLGGLSDPTNSVVLGDVDGDGDIDLVCGNSGQHRLYLNNGTGWFTDATPSHLPVVNDNTNSIALGDVDGDGDLDLACANNAEAREQPNNLCFNDGAGHFTGPTVSRLPSALHDTTSVALGDVDGDGDLDLVCGNAAFGSQNRLYLNDGAGSFVDATAACLPVDNDSTYCVRLGDVDGDGDLDLVCGNYGQNRLYLNNGSGTFTDATATRLPVANVHTWGLALGDVDGDGDLDLVCANTGQDHLLLNDGTGRFTDATAQRLPADQDETRNVAFADVDGDGDLDMVCVNRFYLHRLSLNDGTGTFADATFTHMPFAIAPASCLAFGDVDGDGDLDLALGSDDTAHGLQNCLYLNNGAGVFTDATTTRMPVASDITRAVAFADVDGDGDLDLVCGDGGWALQQQNRLCLNDGTGNFTDVTASAMPFDADHTGSIALGDLDGDGDLDLVCGNLWQNRIAINLQRQLDAPLLLRTGYSARYDVYSRGGPPRAADLALTWLSFNAANVSLPPFGRLGIDPLSAAGPLLAVIPQPAGMASIAVPVPNQANLIGVAVFAQSVLVQPPLQAHFTNVVRDGIVRL